MYTFDVPEILWETGFDLLEVKLFEKYIVDEYLNTFYFIGFFSNWEIPLKGRIILMEWNFQSQTTPLDSVRKVSAL